MFFDSLTQENRRWREKPVRLFPGKGFLEILKELSQGAPLHMFRYPPYAAAKIEKVPQPHCGSVFLQGEQKLRFFPEKLTPLLKGLGPGGCDGKNEFPLRDPAYQALGMILHQHAPLGTAGIPSYVSHHERTAPQGFPEKITSLEDRTCRQIKSIFGKVPPGGAAVGTGTVSPVNVHTSWTMIFGPQETTPPCSVFGLSMRESRGSPVSRRWIFAAT